MASGHATNPPPRVSAVARTERSPGFGPPPAFPVSQWLWSGEPGRSGQVARYSGGAAPAFHRLPSSPVRVTSICSAAASLGNPPSRRKGCLQLLFQLGPLGLVGAPFGRRRLGLAIEELRVEHGDSVQQGVG
jgi:hypothetical protein